MFTSFSGIYTQPEDEWLLRWGPRWCFQLGVRWTRAVGPRRRDRKNARHSSIYLLLR